MILEISNDGVTKLQNGIHHFVLSDYPNIKEWEWNNILAFISYEKNLGHQLEVTCEDDDILSLVNNAVNQLDGTEYIPPIEEAIEEFVYHATDAIAAEKILSSDRILSATKVYGKTGEELAIERREIGWEDPADFYEYVMFGWGTHLVGDYVVLSENFPNEEDFLKGNFDAGVRFYFRYEDIIKHKGHTFDGYHAIKVKGEIILSDYLFACIVPEQYKKQIESCIPQELANRVYYLPQRGLTLEEWNDKVVNFVSTIQ
ncbi:hypothetical protein [Anaeromicropila herbilytica]|uniref:Uncharacterized protein n=1 Tax=Anaeromicropila herbilytica TaxID=2785025 RepID=A0A7R7ELE8_9FIRM|nr:hypothetical protein [Anaeromicropila herbilytica]BCN30944.1 hypothetical protein bsdtb5_22390 [Anaeromicropila herbilytica]